jgi:hypothetical protein
MRVGRAWAGLALWAALAAGCGESNVGDVAGTVTVDGTPVDEGSITFTPADGQGQTAGGPIKAGKYAVRVPPGRMKVSISAPKAIGKKKLYNTPNSPEGTIWKEGLPARYNELTELTFEVKAGKNTKDWELTAK